MALNGLSEEELEKGKTYLIGSYPLRFDTSAKIAAQLVQMQLEGRAPDWLVERNRLIAAVTLPRTSSAPPSAPSATARSSRPWSGSPRGFSARESGGSIYRGGSLSNAGSPSGMTWKGCVSAVWIAICGAP